MGLRVRQEKVTKKGAVLELGIGLKPWRAMGLLDTPDIIFGFVSSVDGSTETAEGAEILFERPGRAPVRKWPILHVGAEIGFVS
jgi:hypothetical protein